MFYDLGRQGLSAREIELNERINKAREKLAAKKEKERLQKLEDELKQLEAELGEHWNDPSVILRHTPDLFVCIFCGL